ncbi:hypothetical protein [Streptomyces sp. R33]|uniref:Uncharacterized protein n=1 Tax=Streptomyces sp. R33 TaxID=3238629 RepID=A0AB39YDS7_9ACTN
MKAFYDAGKLACIAPDAVTGPQVFLAGFPLAGSDPVQGHDFLLEHAAEHENWVFGGAGADAVAGGEGSRVGEGLGD